MKILNIVLLVALSLFSLVLIKTIRDRNSSLDVATNIIMNQRQEFVQYKNEAEETIATQRQLIITQEDAIKWGLLTVEELEKAKIKEAQVKLLLEEKIEILNKEMKYLFGLVDSLESKEPEVIFVDDKKYIEIPHSIYFKDDWLDLNITVSKPSILNHLRLTNQHEFILGWSGTGKWYKDMWSKSEPIIYYSNKNPYNRVEKLENIVIKPELKFYQKRIFWYSLGVATPILLFNIF